MGYRALLAAVVGSIRLICGRAPRRAWIAALVLSFAAASVVSVAAPAFAAVPVPTDSTVSHDHGHDHGGALAAPEAPCDHGQDCDCHSKSDPAHCCAVSAPVALILASAASLPPLQSARCAKTAGTLAVRAGVDPPTPPPRSALS